MPQPMILEALDRAWPKIVETLPRPWPDEVCRLDLVWYEGMFGTIPGRTLLARRWGCTERHARKLLDEHRLPLRVVR